MTYARSIALLVICIARSAVAQPGGDTVGGEALFRQGKQLMKDGKIALACDKFDASDRLDRSIGTLLNLADCREKNGQIATAWATFLEAGSAARSAHDATREAEARARASALEPKLSYLTISVPDASKVEGLIVKRGDALVDPALWNQGVPVDTGTYAISGQAPGHEPWSTSIEIRAGQKTSVEVPRFKRIQELTKVAMPTPAPVETTTDDDGEHDRGPATPATFTTLRFAALGAAAVGIAGIATGVGFAVKANSLHGQSDAICPATACGDDHALALNSQAQHDAHVSDILFGAGGVVVAGAAVLWFVGAPHASETITLAPSIGDRHVGLAFAGRF